MSLTLEQARTQLVTESAGRFPDPASKGKLTQLTEALLHGVDADPFQKGKIGEIDEVELAAAKEILESTKTNDLAKALRRFDPDRMRGRWERARLVQSHADRDDPSARFKLGDRLPLVAGVAPKECLVDDDHDGLPDDNECSGGVYPFDSILRVDPDKPLASRKGGPRYDGPPTAVADTIKAWREARQKGDQKAADKALYFLAGLAEHIFLAIEQDFLERPNEFPYRGHSSDTPLIRWVGRAVRQDYQDLMLQKKYQAQFNVYVGLLNSIYGVFQEAGMSYVPLSACGWPRGRLDIFRNTGQSHSGAGALIPLLPYIPDYLWEFFFSYAGCVIGPE